MSDRVDRGWLAPGRDLRSTHKVSLRFGGRSQFEEFHALCGAVADIGRLCRCGPAAVRSLSAEIEFQRFLNCPLDDADITTIVGLSILDSFGEFIGPLSERPRYPVRCPVRSNCARERNRFRTFRVNIATSAHQTVGCPVADNESECSL